MTDPLASILAADPTLAAIAGRPEHEVQIRYTQITRDVDGVPHFRIFHRLAVRREPWHGRHTNPIRFVEGGRVVYEQPARESRADFAAPRSILKGAGFVEDGVLIDRPKDFADLNAFPLRAQQEILQALLFPEATPEKRRFMITQEDRTRLLCAMGERPRESVFPKYDPDQFPDACTKFLLFGGGATPIPASLRSIGKSGLAYGYVIDNSYLIDFENRVDFLLAAVIHVNADGIFNDDIYEYDTIGLAPSCFYNRNTFAAIMRDAVLSLGLPAEKAHVVRSLAGHIVAGVATEEEEKAFREFSDSFGQEGRDNRAARILDPAARAQASGQQLPHDLPEDVREAVVAAAVAVGEMLVVEAHEVQDGGVEIVHVDGVVLGAHAVLVGVAMDDAGLHSRAGQP